jgi:hypothetical protein
MPIIMAEFQPAPPTYFAWLSRLAEVWRLGGLAGTTEAYTLKLYTHRSTGRDRTAAGEVAGVLLGIGWTCGGCKAAFIGTAPERGRCKACADDDGAAGLPVPGLIPGPLVTVLVTVIGAKTTKRPSGFSPEGRLPCSTW